MRKSLTKTERLGKLSDIKRMFASGKRLSVPGAKLVFVENDLEISRFMITLVRHYGNSVIRNRAKRIAREIYRHNKHRLKPGYDIAVIFFPEKDDYFLREQQITRLFKKAGLYSEKGDFQNRNEATG